jgi:hypothetical protein
MPNYAQGKIYVIRAPGTDRIYIGSTVMPLEKRLCYHRSYTLNGKGCTSRELVTIPGHTIELLEAYPCATVEDLRRKEGWHIRQNAGRVVNKVIAGRTPAEYMAEHADKYRERALAWYYANIPRRRAYEATIREKRLAYQKNYYQTVVKPRKAAVRSVSPPAGTSTISTAMEGLGPAAALNPTSVAAASPAGV